MALQSCNAFIIKLGEWYAQLNNNPTVCYISIFFLHTSSISFNNQNNKTNRLIF